MIPFNRNTPFTLHPDNSPLSDGGAQDERQHGPGASREIPFSRGPDHAANLLAYKIDLFARAVSVVIPVIAGLTIAIMIFCIAST